MVATSQYQTENVYNYTWQQVARAYWNRYPNPASTHVLTEDTIRREVRDGKLYSRRLLSKTNSVPAWGERFYKNTPVKILEDSVLDPKEKTLITYTRNIGMKKIMRVDEIVEYSEQNDGRTLAVRRAYISSQVFGFSRAIRAFGIERFKSNCHKAVSGFNHVLRNMYPMHSVSLTASASGPTANIHHQSIDNVRSEQYSTAATTTQSATTTNKKDALKRMSKTSYEYFKSQASKLLQLFSVKH